MKKVFTHSVFTICLWAGMAATMMGAAGSCSLAPSHIPYTNGDVRTAQLGAQSSGTFTEFWYGMYFPYGNINYNGTGGFTLGDDAEQHGCVLDVDYYTATNATFGVKECTTPFTANQAYGDVIRYQYKPLVQSGYDDHAGGCSTPGQSCTFLSIGNTIGDAKLIASIPQSVPYNGGAFRDLPITATSSGGTILGEQSFEVEFDNSNFEFSEDAIPYPNVQYGDGGGTYPFDCVITNWQLTSPQTMAILMDCGGGEVFSGNGLLLTIKQYRPTAPSAASSIRGTAIEGGLTVERRNFASSAS